MKTASVKGQDCSCHLFPLLHMRITPGEGNDDTVGPPVRRLDHRHRIEPEIASATPCRSTSATIASTTFISRAISADLSVVDHALGDTEKIVPRSRQVASAPP